jgi:hypothetical protein
MGRRLVVASVLLAGCKAELKGEVPTDAVEPDSFQQITIDASLIDAPPTLGPWGTPTLVPGASSASVEDDVTLSSNLLELYFKRVDVATAPQDHNIYVMKRASVSDAWGTASAVTAFNTTGIEESPRLTNDDLTMYFGRAGQIFKSTRTSTTTAWGAATAVTALNTAEYEKWAAVCETYVVVSRLNGTNGQDLFGGTLGGTLTALTPVNSTGADQGTFMTRDCLTLYFHSNRDGTIDMFMTTRAAITDAWPAATKLPDFNTTTLNEEDPWISGDGRVFAFSSNAAGNKDVYLSTR